MDVLEIDKSLLAGLHEKAVGSERLRMNFDLRTSAADGSQRMLNALEPGTKVQIHRHPHSSETVICLEGKMDEVMYDDNGAEVKRISLCPAEFRFGCQVPAGVWHSVEVLEPSVIFESKDGAYGNDGSEVVENGTFFATWGSANF